MHKVLYLFTFVLLMFSLAIAGEPQLYRLDDAHSEAAFHVKYAKLINVEGRFTFLRGALLIDTSDITKSSFTALMKSESINTANDGRDEDLKSDGFFDVTKYPVISFQSTKIEKQGDGYAVTGTFVMHGVTKEITLPLIYLGNTVDQRGNVRVAFESTSKIDRKDYSVNGSPMMVSDSVQLNLTALATKPNLDTLRMTGFGGIKNVGAAMEQTLLSKGVKEAIDQYKSLSTAKDTTYDLGPNQLGMLIRHLADKGKAKDAIEIAKMNVDMNPTDGQQAFMLGYAYQKAGQKDLALAAYKKALELDPFNASAMEMMRWVQ